MSRPYFSIYGHYLSFRTAPPGSNLHVSTTSKNSKNRNFSLRQLTLRLLTAWLRSLVLRTAPPSRSLHVSTTEKNSKTENFPRWRLTFRLLTAWIRSLSSLPRNRQNHWYYIRWHPAFSQSLLSHCA